MIPALLLLLPGTACYGQPIRFDIDALQQFGERRYQMLVSDNWNDSSSEKRKVGSLTLKAIPGKETFSLEISTRMDSPDGKQFIEHSSSARFASDESQELQQIKTRVMLNGKEQLLDGTSKVVDGKFTYKAVSQGEEFSSEMEHKPGTMLDYSLFFLMPQLDLKQGGKLAIANLMNAPTENLEAGTAIEIINEGIDTAVSSSGRKLTRYVRREDGGRDVVYWVDQDRVLRIVQLNAQNRLELIDPQQQASAKIDRGSIVGRWRFAKIDSGDGNVLDLEALGGVGAEWSFEERAGVVNHAEKQRGQWSYEGGNLIVQFEDDPQPREWTVKSIDDERMVITRTLESGKVTTEELKRLKQ